MLQDDHRPPISTTPKPQTCSATWQQKLKIRPLHPSPCLDQNCAIMRVPSTCKKHNTSGIHGQRPTALLQTNHVKVPHYQIGGESTGSSKLHFRRHNSVSPPLRRDCKLCNGGQKVQRTATLAETLNRKRETETQKEERTYQHVAHFLVLKETARVWSTGPSNCVPGTGAQPETPPNAPNRTSLHWVHGRLAHNTPFLLPVGVLKFSVLRVDSKPSMVCKTTKILSATSGWSTWSGTNCPIRSPPTRSQKLAPPDAQQMQQQQQQQHFLQRSQTLTMQMSSRNAITRSSAFKKLLTEIKTACWIEGEKKGHHGIPLFAPPSPCTITREIKSNAPIPSMESSIALGFSVNNCNACATHSVPALGTAYWKTAGASTWVSNTGLTW